MVGAADALHDPARPFGRADVDDEIHVAPVDAEIEGRGADHGLEPAFDHSRLDAPALGDVEGAVMEGDGEGVLVQAPERLEDVLRLHAGVDEDERGLVGADEVVDRRHGGAGRVPGHGQAPVRLQHADVGLGAAFDRDEVGEGRRLPSRA